MLDPCLFDRLVADEGKLALDSLEYIEECHQIMIGLQQQLIERHQELIALRERATYLNNLVKVIHERPAPKISYEFSFPFAR